MDLLMSRVPEEKKNSFDAIEAETLVRRTAAGDVAAFEQLVVRYERRVLTLALRFLRTLDDAQDAAQEVFLRVYKYIHRLDPRKPIEPWLMRMTVNVCRDIGRKRQRRWRTFSDLAEHDAACASARTNPHEGFTIEQQRSKLRDALESLPEKERAAIILRDIEGFSTAEVAAILESSETTVRSQICRGRLKIKAAMDIAARGRQ
jgi:RNA polymerase sigma-70 factor (ECF subfamily)